MLIKIIFIILVILCVNQPILAQKKELPSIGVGVGFRFTEWVLESKYGTANPYDFTYQFQDNKARLSIDIKQKIFKKKNYTLQLSNYFAYTEFRRVRASPNSNVNVVDKTLKRDHFLDIFHPFKSKKQRPQFVLGAGLGFMNFGTKFKYEKFTIDSNGSYTSEIAKGTMRFFAPRIMVGIQKKAFNGFAIFHGTPDRQGEPYPTIWMEIKATMSFRPFVKRKD